MELEFENRSADVTILSDKKEDVAKLIVQIKNNSDSAKTLFIILLSYYYTRDMEMSIVMAGVYGAVDYLYTFFPLRLRLFKRVTIPVLPALSLAWILSCIAFSKK